MGASDRIAEEVALLSSAKLKPIITSALDDSTASLDGQVQAEALNNISVGPGTVALVRCSGNARTSSGIKKWSAILKVLEHDAPNQFGIIIESVSTRRELTVFRSGLFDLRSGTLRGAKCHHIEDKSEKISWLWMEDLTEYTGNDWTSEQYLLATDGIGIFEGSWMQKPLPDYEWMDRNPVLKEILNGPLIKRRRPVLEETADTEFVRAALPETMYGRVINLFDQVPLVIRVAMTLPSTVAHNDFHIRNLFASPASETRQEIVAIDFGRVGIEHVGGDAGDLFGSGFSWTDAEARTLMEIPDDYYRAWTDGLVSSGWQTTTEITRFGFLARVFYRAIAVACMPSMVESGQWGDLPLRRFGGSKEEMPSSCRRRMELLLPMAEEAISLARQLEA